MDTHRTSTYKNNLRIGGCFREAKDYFAVFFAAGFFVGAFFAGAALVAAFAAGFAVVFFAGAAFFAAAAGLTLAAFAAFARPALRRLAVLFLIKPFLTALSSSL